ncbi:hypothetical protein BHM03_00037842 [Ensete ventricosum]|nr:hypothetical protein BHM03_00037842 [Ensete ventricosum]
MYGDVGAKPSAEGKQQAKLPLPEIKWEHQKIHDQGSVLNLSAVPATHGTADGSIIIASCSEDRQRAYVGIVINCGAETIVKKRDLYWLSLLKNPNSKIWLSSPRKDMKEKPQLAARTFHAPPQILDIDGFIKHQPVTILVDTRSSNDLMNDKRKHMTLCGKGENEEKMILTQCLEKLAEI